MQYRTNIKNGDMLSALGFGCMRFPSVGKDIDRAESIRVLRLAHELGMNYFDTAYVYYDGKSEDILGEAVEPFRSEIKLATKLPLGNLKSREDFDKIFETSLKRLRTDHIDYYLLHCILTHTQFVKLQEMGITQWIEQKKAEGKIINIGFSYHGTRDDFRAVIDAYDWDFCQIQYNYMDVAYQAGRAGLRYAHEKGLPVIIMEPLRGGALVNKLPSGAQKVFHDAAPDRGFADWGLRWLWNQPEVTVVLSGMGSEQMLTDNIATADSSGVDTLTEADNQVYDRVLDSLANADRINCTACAYCMPCPRGVDIPACFAAYNTRGMSGKIKALSNYVSSCGGLSSKPALASQCVACGACMKKCPQHLAIPQELKRVKKAFHIPFFGLGLKIAKKVTKV